MTGTRSPRLSHRCKRWSATSSIAASPMPAIAATTPRPITSSRSTRPAKRLHLWDDRGERVPVIGIAGQCCGMGDELPAGGMLHRGGDAHLDTELVRPVRLA